MDACQQAPRAADPAAARAAVEASQGQAAAGSALRPEDYVHARLNRFARLVEASIHTIRRALEIGPLGVSFSGGKDSTVVVDLVRRVADAPLAFFDSGAELVATGEMIAHVGADTIHPRLTMLEMARYSGWWGYRTPIDPGCPFDAKRILIEEPAETFVVRRGLLVIAHGVRGEESHARSLHTRSRGDLYQGRDRTWRCMPIARWSTSDVWAYIASRGLRYHPAYDRMSGAGLPRVAWRVSGALGERGSGWGRHAILRMIEPETWGRLVAEFPLIGLQ